MGIGGYQQINKALNICAFEGYLDGQLKHLPVLADVEQLSPRVIRVLGQNAGKVINSHCFHRVRSTRLTFQVHATRNEHVYNRDWKLEAYY